MFFIGLSPAILLGVIRYRMFEPDLRRRAQALRAGQQIGTGERGFVRFVTMQLFSKADRLLRA